MRLMGSSLIDLEGRIRAIDDAIEPIANRPVDLTEPGWMDRLKSRPHPFDQAAVRSEGESATLDLVDGYLTEDQEWRVGARRLFKTYRWFAWSATLPLDRATEPGFRAHLALFSIADQGLDPRDARLALDDLTAVADSTPLDARAALTEVALLSSEDDPYGWGSTRSWLEKAATAV